MAKRTIAPIGIIGILAVVIAAALWWLMPGGKDAPLSAQAAADVACATMREQDHDVTMLAESPGHGTLTVESRRSDGNEHAITTARDLAGNVMWVNEIIVYEGWYYERATLDNDTSKYTEWAVHGTGHWSDHTPIPCFPVASSDGASGASGESESSGERRYAYDSRLDAETTVTNEFWVGNNGLPTRGRRTFTVAGTAGGASGASGASSQQAVSNETYSGFGESNNIAPPFPPPTATPVPTTTATPTPHQFQDWPQS